MRHQLTLSGTIRKKETLEPIMGNVIANTSVCEASNPYANYYGRLPQKAKPNSLFFHTQQFLFLEDILYLSSQIEKCLHEKINLACALITYNNKQYPAIRIKNFPNYSLIKDLQQCLVTQGIEFSPQVRLQGEFQVVIKKLFVVEEVDNGIYFDTIEENKGYFINEKQYPHEPFDEIIKRIKNNRNCKLFDAVEGNFLIDGTIKNIIRIYSEGLNTQLLQNIKNCFAKIA